MRFATVVTGTTTTATAVATIRLKMNKPAYTARMANRTLDTIVIIGENINTFYNSVKGSYAI